MTNKPARAPSCPRPAVTVPSTPLRSTSTQRHYADQAATGPTNPLNPVVILNDDFVCKISDGQHF
jgi:hypothetical protein